MVLYEKSSLKVAEVFFDEPDPRASADIIRYHFRSAPVAHGQVTGLQTLLIDLKSHPDALLAGMNSNTRYEIRRAAKDTLIYEFQSAPDAAWLQEFFGFYDQFAPGKDLPLANRVRLTALRRDGMLDLSRMRGDDGQVLVWHAYVRGATRARLLHSASLFRDLSKETANLISRANRLNHWADMQRFRDDGLSIYDFGGWYAGQEDTAKLRINDFKRGFGGTVVPQYNSDCSGTWKGAAALSLRSAIQKLRGREE